MRGTKKRVLRLESLEPRLQLAGLITAAVVDGDLVITGDAEFNEVRILPALDNGSAIPGTYEVVGKNETSINTDGQTSVVLEGMDNDFIIEMPEGGYDLRVGNESGPTQRTLIPGDFRAHTGLHESDEQNRFRLEGTDVGGDVFVKTEPGGQSNSLTLSYSTVAGSVNVETGRNLDFVSLFRSDVTGDFNVTGMLGAGPVPKTITHSDRIDLYFGNVGGNVSIKGIPGSGITAKVDWSQITGSYTVEAGPGYDRVKLRRSEFGEVTVNTGARRDWLTLDDSTVDKLYANLGGGTNLAELFDSTVNTSAAILTAGGHDVVGAQALNVGEKFRLNTGGGRDIVFIGSNPSWVPASPIWWQPNDWNLAGSGLTAGSVSIITGGGNDWFELQKSQITLDAQLFTGGGNDRVRLGNSQFGGSVRLLTGAGSDLINLLGCEVAGHTVVNAGGGNDKLRASSNDLSGNLVLHMGSGRDLLVARFNKVVGRAGLFGSSGLDTLAQQKNSFGDLQVAGFEKIK